jgi:hypothetical protein
MKKAWTASILVTAAFVFTAPAAFGQSAGNFSTVTVGTGYVSSTPPTNGMIIQGNVGVGTSAPSAGFDAATSFRSIGRHLATSGVGLEMDWNSSLPAGAIDAYDRTNSAYKNLYVDGEQLYLNGASSGVVGVGTTEPSAGFDAATSLRSTGRHLATSGVGLEMDWNGSVGVVDAYDRTNSVYKNLYVDGAQLYLNGASGGKVGIGNTAPAYLLHVGSPSVSGTMAEFQNSSGDCTFTPSAGTLGIACASDIRLKRDIRDSGSALSWLAGMHIRDYTIKSTGQNQTGVIAQELQSSHPDMVHANAQGTYMAEQPNPWKLVKAIQEQQAEIGKQQAEIDELKQTIKQLTQQRD